MLCDPSCVVRIIRAELTGRETTLGRVPAVDVARLIIGLERALARAAYIALGRTRGTLAGRHKAAIEQASRLRFLGIEQGSVVELLALPNGGVPSEGQLDVTVEHLAGHAFNELLQAIGSGGDGVDMHLAGAVALLGDDLGIGERNDKLMIGDADPKQPLRPPNNQVVLDYAVRMRMKWIASRAEHRQENVLVGTLVEADFEKFTARLRSQGGRSVIVSYQEDMADDVHQALRRPAQLIGEVAYDPQSAAARSIELRQVTRADQLALDDRIFYAERNVVEHAVEQGIRGPADLADLRDPEMTDEEREAFLANCIDA